MEVFRKDPKDNNDSDRDKCRECRKDMAKTKKEIQIAQKSKEGGDVLDKLNLRFRKLQEAFNKACKAISAQTADQLQGAVKPLVIDLAGTEATDVERQQTKNVKEGIIKLNVDDKKADKKALENLSKEDLKKEKLEKEEKKTKESSEEKKETIAKQSDKVSDIESTEWKEADAEQEEAKELGSKSTDREEEGFVEKEKVTEDKKKSES